MQKKKLRKVKAEEVDDEDTYQRAIRLVLHPRTLLRQTITSNTELRKMVCSLIPHPTPLMTHTPEAKRGKTRQSYIPILRSCSP